VVAALVMESAIFNARDISFAAVSDIVFIYNCSKVSSVFCAHIVVEYRKIRKSRFLAIAYFRLKFYIFLLKSINIGKDKSKIISYV
ncbi:hypothetical protein SB768_31260, partial [Burkholderia sp. SIMBA_043]|uniref:hypothetical protein n=1 Tax=Burkholderia sp. SIMBA_043 TaxID=3085784 RepID=UPI00397CF36B